MQVRALWWLLLLPLSTAALANPDIERLEALLADPIETLQHAQSVHGQFQQTKTLSGFDHPLVSRGEFLQVRGRGVLWRTLEPIQSKMVLTPDGVAGLPGNHNGAAARALSDIFMGLFELDLDHLSQRFELESSEPQNDEQWALQLVPRDPSLRQVIGRARIAGRDTLERVQFEDSLGDATHIELLGVKMDSDTPDTGTLNRFKP